MEIACPHCGKKYKVSDAAAGKKARCANSNCQQMFAVPALPASTAPQATPAKPAAAAPAPKPAAKAVLVQPGQQAKPVALKAVPAAQAVPSQPVAAQAAGGIIDLGDGIAPAADASPLDSLLAAEMGAGIPAGPSPLGPATLTAVPASPLGPVSSYGRARRRGLNNPLVIAGAVGGVVAVILVVVLILVLSGGGSGGSGGPGIGGSSGDSLASNGLPTWAAYCVPPDARLVVYCNADKVRQSELFRLLERLGTKFNPAGMKDFPRSEIEKLKDVYVAASARGDHFVIVIRTKDDTSSTDAIFLEKGKPGTVTKKTNDGMEYSSSPSGCAAKTGPYTFCFSRREEDVQAALARFQRKEALPLPNELREAMQKSRGDVIAAATDIPSFIPTGGLGGPKGEQPVSAGVGLYLDSNVRVEAAVTFASSAQAANVKQQFDQAMSQLDKMAGMAPPQERAKVDKMLKMIRAVRMSQSGSTLQVSGSWNVRDIEELVNQAQSMIPGGRFGG